MGTDADPAFAAETMALPSETFLADQMAVADPDAIHAVREAARTAIGMLLAPILQASYEQLTDSGPYQVDGASIGRRALRNTCLAYIAAGSHRLGAALAKRNSTPGGI